MRRMSRAADQTRLLTVDEVASTLRLSRQSIYRLIEAQVIPAHRVGSGLGSLRVDADELGDYLERRRTTRETA